MTTAPIWGFGFTDPVEEGWGGSATPEEAIKEAAEHIVSDPDRFPDEQVYLYRGRPPLHPADAIGNDRIEDLLEITEWGSHEDYLMDAADGFPDLTRDQENSFVAAVRDAIRKWLADNPAAMPTWWVYDGETRAVDPKVMAEAIARLSIADGK